MNANELADAIRGCGDCSYNEDAYIMLRQQQAEIEALKLQLHTTLTNRDLRTYDGKTEMNNEPVAYVDKIWIDRPDFVMSQQLDIGRLFMRSGKEIKNYIPLYTHPVKELTDEEIADLIANKVTDSEMIKQALRKVQGDV